jgi:hypothetical protein
MQTETPTYTSSLFIRDLFRRLNNAGEGFRIGDDADSSEQAAIAENWLVLYSPTTVRDYTVAYDAAGDGFMLIADIHGPWAIEVPDHSLAAWASKAERLDDAEMAALVRRASEGDIDALREVWALTVRAIAEVGIPAYCLEFSNP